MSRDAAPSQRSLSRSDNNRFSFASRLGLILLCFLIITPSLLTPSSVRASTANSGVWTQKTQQDFQSDTLNNLDTTTSPGNVILAAGGSIVHMGFPATTRSSGYAADKNGLTVIQVTAGSAAPVSGTLQKVHLYVTGIDPNGGQLFKLKVFRDNGTHFVLVGQTGNFFPSTGENSFSTGSIPVQRGDYLGFFWRNATIAGDAFIFGGDNRVMFGSDVTTDTPKSSWGSILFSGSVFACIFFFFLCVTDEFSVDGDVVPNVAGNLISTVWDTGGNSTWGKLNFTATVPLGTSLSFNTRTSNDSVLWAPWSASYTSTGTNITSPPGRFIQYSALFSAQGTLTPILNNVTINYASLALSILTPTTTVGSPITVTGTLAGIADGTVTLTYTRPDKTTLTRTVTSASGSFTDAYAPDRTGAWSVKASVPRTKFIGAAQSFPQTFQVQPQPSSNLVVSVSVQSILTGGKIQITGMITPPTATSIVLTFTSPDGTNTNQTVTSNSAGVFQYTFSPNKSGLWQLKASWSGNTQTAGSQSNIQSFQVQEPPSFLSANLPWLILIAVVIGFGVAVVLMKPKPPAG